MGFFRIIARWGSLIAAGAAARYLLRRQGLLGGPRRPELPWPPEPTPPAPPTEGAEPPLPDREAPPTPGAPAPGEIADREVRDVAADETVLERDDGAAADQAEPVAGPDASLESDPVPEAPVESEAPVEPPGLPQAEAAAEAPPEAPPEAQAEVEGNARATVGEAAGAVTEEYEVAGTEPEVAPPLDETLVEEGGEPAVEADGDETTPERLEAPPAASLGTAAELTPVEGPEPPHEDAAGAQEAVDLAEPAEVAEAEEVAEADEVAQPEGLAEADEVAPVEQVAEPEEVTEGEAHPEEVPEAEEVVEPQEVAEDEEVAQGEEAPERDARQQPGRRPEGGSRAIDVAVVVDDLLGAGPSSPSAGRILDADVVEDEESGKADAAVAEAVRVALAERPGLLGGALDVEVSRGVVFLRGEVERVEAIPDLERRAAAVEGVREVRNLLRSSGGGPPTADPP